jgi:hypothetical protein
MYVRLSVYLRINIRGRSHTPGRGIARTPFLTYPVKTLDIHLLEYREWRVVIPVSNSDLLYQNVLEYI